MYISTTAGGDPMNIREQQTRQSRIRRRPSVVSVVAIVLAVVAILLALALRGCSEFQVPFACESTETPFAPPSTALSAYDLWLTMGNTGTVRDFLNSLVGTPGPSGYRGSDGLTGAKGATGKSAYQVWLDEGNAGTPQDFLDSLLGDNGEDGASGLSAYELWMTLGNSGSPQDFLDSLVGTQGANGASGTPGQDGMSAYHLWLALGNSGTEAQFLASLVGATGAPGICTTGDTGATGATGATGSAGTAGLSAYEIWLSQSNFGTENDFLESLVGATGPVGPPGLRGDRGETGPAGPGGFGASAAYSSSEDQGPFAPSTIQAMTLNTIDWEDGVALESGSHIRILNPGRYNIAFSAQVNQTNSQGVVEIWLAKNGVPVADSNTRLDINANNPFTVAAWNFFVTANANDYYEIMWSSDDDHTVIQHVPARGSGPTLHPAVPSLILTVNQVG